jgi:hypothetical protein
MTSRKNIRFLPCKRKRANVLKLKETLVMETSAGRALSNCSKRKRNHPQDIQVIRFI